MKNSIVFSFISILFLGFTYSESSISLPQFYFIKNSIEYNEKEINHRNDFDNPNQNSDSVLQFIIDVVNIRKTLVIEIMGHASFDENHPNKISLKRAQKVVSDLVKLGVDSSQFAVSGEGIDRLMIEPYHFEKLTAEEQIAAHNVNRRVSFRVIK